MSSFFERNKKKSLLAALLLLLKRGKGGVALFVMVALLAGVFVLPGGMRIPWASKGGAKPGFDNQADAKRFADMAAAIRTARDSKSELGVFKALWGARAASNQSTWQNQGKSTVELVKGKLPEFDETKGWEGQLGSARSVAGIAAPGGPQSDNSVQLEKAEFLNGLVRSADAGVMAAGGPLADPGVGSDPGKMADGGKMAALEKGAAINPGGGVMEQALKFTDVPDPKNQAVQLPKGEKYDKLDASSAKQLAFGRYGINKATADLYQPTPSRGKPAFYQLAEARAYSVTAAPPTCKDACPKEYAHTTSAIVFDGQKPGMGIMTSAELDENTSPIVPQQDGADGINAIVSETMKYYDDTKKCEAAELWASGMSLGSNVPPEVKTYHAEIVSSRGTVDQVAQKGCTTAWLPDSGAGAGRSCGMPLVKCCNGRVDERSLMKEMQLLSCAMSCVGTGGDGAKPMDSEGVCSEVNQIGSNCLNGPCDSGSCDKNKAQRCKDIGNRMRDVCYALRAIWRVKHQSCPLAYGADQSSQGDFHECQQ